MTAASLLPCASPENDPDWWFIEKDGGAAEAKRDGVTMTPDEISAALRRRRQAKDKCFLDCPTSSRLRCLDFGLSENNQTYGIYGSYYPEERRKIVEEMKKRGIEQPKPLVP